ncbi:MAG: thioredoxin family protein [Acidobacteriota bacterium]
MRSILTLLLVALTLPATAQQEEKASVRLLADHTAYAAGSSARLAAVVAIDEGWHVNSNTPTFDWLIPTEISLEGPAGWSEPQLLYPAGVDRTFAFADQALSVYEGEVKILAAVPIPAGTGDGEHRLSGELLFQACDHNSCLPPVRTPIELAVTVGAGGQPANAAVFGNLSGDPAATATATTGLPWMLLLAVIGGLILNAMPCVLPVLSLKVFGLVKSAGQGRGSVVSGALATTSGILVSFWALALAAVAARSAGAAIGWGVQFQQPVFVTFLAVVVLLFSLNLWGLFEIMLPGRAMGALGGGPKEGFAGHFVSGLFATLMATPCSAPFLGTAVGFALAQPAIIIFAIFTAVGVGMALPYLLLAVFPGAARLLPKPGPWMDTLRKVMGFLLAAAAIWLLYVLAGQVSAERLAFIEVGLLLIALFVWLRSQGQRVGKALAGLATVGAIVTTLGLAASASPTGGKTSNEVVHLIPWQTFDRGQAESLAAEGQMVFVDVTADWCFTCKTNERLVLETPEVADLFERYDVVPMKADWTNRDDAIAAFLSDYGRFSIPFYMLYRPGQEPHLFGELLTRAQIASALEGSAAQQLAASQH